MAILFENNFSSLEKFRKTFSDNVNDLLLSDDKQHDNDLLFETYLYILRSRHDYIHFVFTTQLFGKWVPEKQIKEIFPEFNEKGFDKTPDIVYETKDKIYLIDVSVTTRDIYTMIKEKKEKYEPVAVHLKQIKNKEIMVLPFVFKTNGKNFEDLQKNFFDFFDKDLPITPILNFFELCEELYNEVIQKMDRTFFDKRKEESFGHTLLTPLIKDTKISIDIMRKIQMDKYPYHLDTSLEEQTLMEILKKNINYIENNKFFIDHKLDPNDYNMVTRTLVQENEKYNIKIGPTFLLLLPPTNQTLQPEFDKHSEQKMILNFMKHFCDNYTSGDSFGDFYKTVFKKTIDALETQEGHEFNYEVFTEGIGDIDSKHRKNYHDEMKTYDKKERAMSFRKYLHEKKILNVDIENKTYCKRPKTIVFDFDIKEENFRTVWTKSGVNFYKTHDVSKIRKSEKKTTPLKEWVVIDKFINFLKTKDNDFIHKQSLKNLYKFLINKNTVISDDPRLNTLRDYHVEEYKQIVKTFLSTKMAKFLWFNHLAMSQLMHYLSFNNKNNELTFFNCGDPNFLCIMTGGYKSVTERGTKAFMSCVITEKPEEYDCVYGDLTKIQLKNDLWFITTGWRRMSQDKCTFIRDSFYSVFSSSINLYFDMMNMDYNYWLELSAIKTIISCCTNQQIQEFLMDNRYAMMSSFSTYTNLLKLLVSKFSPPYKNALSVWIVNRLTTRLGEITKAVQTGSIKLNMSIPENLYKTERTLGGEINIPSLWTNYTCTNIEQILEEAFIYVHTMKEPANMFHEKIKAVNTIREYQEKFNNTPNMYKYGTMKTEYDFINYIGHCQNSEIGFSSNVIFHSFKNLMNIIKPNFSKIINSVLSESLGEIVSTKSVIHSLEREIQEVKEEKNRLKIIKRFAKKLSIVKNDDVSLEEAAKNIHIYKQKNKSKIYAMKERQKVWETIIEIMEGNPEMETVEDLCQIFIEKQGAEVEADICIKSQYGSKREFYVINVGAKAMARITEKFFQKLCENCQSECISVSGDKKMINMQKNLDDAQKYCKRNFLKMRYVNGDCTKWSAAETMGSFLSMVEALKTDLPVGFYNLLKTCFSTWADKKINIPYDIYTNVLPLIEKTKYLVSTEEKKKYIHSTHNFLQGMFNYASSLKASSCNYYTTKLWMAMYPESKLKSFHLEHSDDYVQVIVYETETEFLLFRQMYKYMMRLHGYNDSVRKTSCQQLFMEFVSLMSFNGKMLYPKIKKSKEINLNLPCTGYKEDIEAALSRQGECLRMGCNMSFCYFFMKLHVYCVREAYSLIKGMRNEIQNEYDTPIELFGNPDQLPIFSLYCKGNINNYRLFKHSVHGRKTLEGLYNYTLTKGLHEEEIRNLDMEDYKNYILSPKFVYENYSTILSKMRKHFGINMETSKKYWEENITYKFLKPRTHNKLLLWLKLMFYNRGFTEAYVKVSRTKMTMRLAQYVSKKTIRIKFVDDDENTQLVDKLNLEKKLYTMRDYHKKMLLKLSKYHKPVDDKILQKIVLRSDPTATAIYSIIENMSIMKMEEFFTVKKPTQATYTPPKIGWFFVENNASILLQYIYNKDNYILDKRTAVSEISLERDVETIDKYFKPSLNPNLFEIQTLFNDIQTAKYSPIVYMGFQRTKHTLLDAVIDQLQFNFFKHYSFNCKTKGVNVVLNPYSGIPFFLGTRNKPMQNTGQMCLETLCLIYTTLNICYGFKTAEIKKFLENIIFTHIEDDIVKKFNYVDLLETFTPDIIETSKYPIYILKIAAYLRELLVQKPDFMNKFVSGVYTYTYYYDSQGQRFEDKYIGKTIARFTYMNNVFLFHQDNNDIPIMYTNVKNIDINKSAFMIALKLSNNLTETKLMSYLRRPDMSKYVGQYSTKTIPIKAKMVAGEIDRWVYSNLTQKSYPIFFTDTIIKRPNEEQNQILLNERACEINTQHINVMLGMQKLYTLPFWQCKQYPVIDIKRDDFFINIPLKDWLSKNLFQKICLTERLYKEDLKNYNIDSNTKKTLEIKYNKILEDFNEQIFPKIKPIKDELDSSKKQINEIDQPLVDPNEFTLENLMNFEITSKIEVQDVFDPSEELFGEGEKILYADVDEESEENQIINPLLQIFDTIDMAKITLAFKPIQKVQDQPKRYNYYIRNARNKQDISYYYYKLNVFNTNYQEISTTELFNVFLSLNNKIKTEKNDYLLNLYMALAIYIFTECRYSKTYYSEQDIMLIRDNKGFHFYEKIILEKTEIVTKHLVENKKIILYESNLFYLAVVSIKSFDDYKNQKRFDKIKISKLIRNKKVLEEFRLEKNRIKSKVKTFGFDLSKLI